MVTLLVSFVITVSLAPLVRGVLLRRGLLDVPNDRSSHVTPVPRGGGLSCLAGILGGLGVAAIVGLDVPWLAVAVAVGLAGVGYADDTTGIAPVLRLGAQIAGGAAIGWSFGGAPIVALGAVCLPVVVNAVNFMDGINGITSLNAAAWGGVALAVGLVRDVPVLVAIGAATAGAALGFLPWNAPRARMFLGDVGSYLFGAMVTVGVVAAVDGSPVSLIVVAPLAIYLADTGTALVKRALRRESLMTAHREHVFQRLVNEVGLPHVGVASLTALLALAITAAWLPGSIWWGVTVTVVVVALYLASPGVLRRMGLVSRCGIEALGLSDAERGVT